MPKRTFTEEEHQARHEADRQRTREVVQALSEGWQNWLRLRHEFHDFSLSNQLLIAASMPEATRVAGFKKWLKLGDCVRRGESTRSRIWIPMPPSKAQLAEWEAAGSRPADRPRVRFRLGPVWDRSQVQELPPPAEPATLDPPIEPVEGDSLAWVFPRLVTLTEELGCALVIEPASRRVRWLLHARAADAGAGGVDRELPVLHTERRSSVSWYAHAALYEGG